MYDFRSIKAFFGKGVLCVIIFALTACFSSPTTSAKQAAEHYKIESKDGKLRLTDAKNKPVNGWFIKIGKKFYPLGELHDAGFYETSKVQLIYAKRSGYLPANATVKKIKFDEKGYPVSTGLFRIHGKYYFLQEGHIQTEDITYKEKKYVINLQSEVTHYTKKKNSYTPAGKKLSEPEQKNAKARSLARIIIKLCTKKSMSQEKKLEKCYDWIIEHRLHCMRTCDGKKGWTSEAAIDMFRTNSGDCRTYAAGFAFLASELGYKRVYLHQNHIDQFSDTHCWTSVNGRYYDPYYYKVRKPKKYKNAYNGSTPKQFAYELKCYSRQKFKPGE